MAKGKKIIFCIVICFLSFSLSAQKLGLVLSGGGSKGLAHIGVLKALEENGIPVNYITGTSAGALIGALYATGWSPQEIEALVLSDRFKTMVEGKMESKYIYYFKKPDLDASWIRLRFSPDSVILRNIPSNLLNPASLDIEMLSVFAGPEADAGYNFDSLFIPYRCVASDINAKQSVVFKSGNLNQAVRASMSYPFYLKPISVDGKLLFDGGLYKNFPVDVMEQAFNPDIIIGSLVTSNATKPDDEDIFNQLENMIVNKQNFKIDCDLSYLILPNLNGLTTFDFSRIKESIDSGYAATIRNIDSIKRLTTVRISQGELQRMRAEYRLKLPQPEYSSITIDGLKENQKKYIQKTFTRKQTAMTLEHIKPRFYKAYTDEKIKFIFPQSKYDSLTKKYSLSLIVKKDKPFVIAFGGNISSRPVNTGFVAFQYHLLSSSAWTFNASTSFGKFYTAGKGSIRFEPAARRNYYLEAEFNIHRWDYFKSSNLFYEDKKPSYLIQDEEYAGLNISTAIGTKGKLKVQFRYGQLIDSYYRTESFTTKDTADKTKLYAATGMISYERNSLNRKSFASEGSYLRLSARLISGLERTIPGNTSTIRDTIEEEHLWPVFRFEFQKYFFKKSDLHLGFSTENVFSFQPFYGNYTASLLSAPSYAPILETKTLFMPELRAHKYLSAGMQLIVSVTKNIDLRAESYYFQPLNSLQMTADGKTEYSVLFLKRSVILSGVGVYHSPVGPLSISVNYYPENVSNPVSFMFNFGYLIFNDRTFN